MFAIFRKSRFLAAAILLLILFTITGKEVIHSFVVHTPISCVEHVKGEDELTHDTEIGIDSYRYCILCHFEFSTFYATEKAALSDNLITGQIIKFNAPLQANIQPELGFIALRGPPSIG